MQNLSTSSLNNTSLACNTNLTYHGKCWLQISSKLNKRFKIIDQIQCKKHQHSNVTYKGILSNNEVIDIGTVHKEVLD
jgi:hypothetical protein